MDRIKAALYRFLQNTIGAIKQYIVRWAREEDENQLTIFANNPKARKAHKDFVKIKIYVDIQNEMAGKTWACPTYVVNGKQMKSLLYNYRYLADRVFTLEATLHDLIKVGDDRLR